MGIRKRKSYDRECKLMIVNLVYSGRDAKSVADENYLDKEFKTNAPRKACVSDLIYVFNRTRLSVFNNDNGSL